MTQPQVDPRAAEDLAIIDSVIAQQVETLRMLEESAVRDPMGDDGLDSDRRVIEAMRQARAALEARNRARAGLLG